MILSDYLVNKPFSGPVSNPFSNFPMIMPLNPEKLLMLLAPVFAVLDLVLGRLLILSLLSPDSISCSRSCLVILRLFLSNDPL
jgi:hypothetical protein